MITVAFVGGGSPLGGLCAVGVLVGCLAAGSRSHFLRLIKLSSLAEGRQEVEEQRGLPCSLPDVPRLQVQI